MEIYAGVLSFFLRKMKLRKRITFIATKNRTRMTIVSAGFTGARVASSIMGKPKITDFIPGSRAPAAGKKSLINRVAIRFRLPYTL